MPLGVEIELNLKGLNLPKSFHLKKNKSILKVKFNFELELKLSPNFSNQAKATLIYIANYISTVVLFYKGSDLHRL